MLDGSEWIRIETLQYSLAVTCWTLRYSYLKVQIQNPELLIQILRSNNYVEPWKAAVATAECS
jgi:hypothetical protein